MGNNLCHFEILSSDVGRSKAFYGKVFDWRFDESSFPGYVVIRSGAEPTGGMMTKPPEAPHPTLNVYFEVDSIDDTLRTVTAAGGAVLVGKTEIPRVGHWAMIADLDGIAVGLLEPLTR